MRMTILSTLTTLALLTQPVIAPAQETTGQSMTAPGLFPKPSKRRRP